MASRAPRSGPVREARSCYDHLAGRLGVAVTAVLLERGWVLDEGGSWRLAPGAESACAGALGLDLRMDRRSRRPAARPCPDWTERTPHLAGRFGAAVLDSLLVAGWVSRLPDSRALEVTEHGRTALRGLGVPAGDPPTRPRG